MFTLRYPLVTVMASASIALAQSAVLASTSSKAVHRYMRCVERGRVHCVLYRTAMAFLPDYLEVVRKTTPFKSEAMFYAGLVEWERYEQARARCGERAAEDLLKSAWEQFGEVAEGSDELSAAGVRARLYRAACACLSRKFGPPRGVWREATRDLEASERYLENAGLAIYLCSRFHGCSLIPESKRRTWESQLKESIEQRGSKGLNKNFVLYGLAARAYHQQDWRAACGYLDQVMSDGHEARVGSELAGRSLWSPAAFRMMGYARLRLGAEGLSATIGKSGQIDPEDIARCPALGDSLLPIDAHEVAACGYPAAVLRYVAGEALFDCGAWAEAEQSFGAIRPQMLSPSLWRRTQAYGVVCRALLKEQETGATLAWTGRDRLWRQAKQERDWRAMALLAILGGRFGCGNTQEEAAQILQTADWREDASIDYRMERRVPARAAAAALFAAGIQAPQTEGRRTRLLRECSRLCGATFDIGLAWKPDDDGKHPPVYLAMYGAALAANEEYEKAYGEIYYELSPVRGFTVAEAMKEIWRRIQVSRRRQSG